MVEIRGERVRLEPVAARHAPALRHLVVLPGVARWWGPVSADWPLDEDASTAYAVHLGPRIVGFARYDEETNPDYRHAWLDVFLDPALHRRGLGRDTVLALARHLVRVRGHHRLSIDPTALNTAAIRCYESVGFRAVGVLRAYERDPGSGGWRNGLLMDLLAAELASR